MVQTVIEVPRRLEPVSRDTFIDGLSDAEAAGKERLHDHEHRPRRRDANPVKPARQMTRSAS